MFHLGMPTRWTGVIGLQGRPRVLLVKTFGSHCGLGQGLRRCRSFLGLALKLLSISWRSASISSSRLSPQIQALIRTLWVNRLDGEITSPTPRRHWAGDSSHRYSICKAWLSWSVISGGDGRCGLRSKTSDFPALAAFLTLFMSSSFRASMRLFQGRMATGAGLPALFLTPSQVRVPETGVWVTGEGFRVSAHSR